MRDPYTVLGVPKTASAADIKKAYRKLAKKYHPDQSTEPKAKDRFAEIGSAYEIVGDEKKRASFDRGEIDADGKPRFEGFGAGGGAAGGFRRSQGSPFGFENFEFHSAGPGARAGGAGFDPSDLFGDLFGAGRRASAGGGGGRSMPRGEDVAASVTVSLNEAAKGTKTRVTLPTGRTLEISVPPGIEDGKQIRLKGQGMPSSAGGDLGDAMVTVHVAKHAYFRTDGRDLRLDLPLALYEAVLGAKVNVPTLDGAVELNVPANSNSGRTLRLRGKGLPAAGATPAGDLLVTLRLMLPDAADPDLVELMRKWQAEKPYHPRKDLA